MTQHVVESSGTRDPKTSVLRPALLAPIWPASAGANGIATYVETILPALLEEGCDPVVLTASLANGYSDPRVRSLAIRRRGIGRILDSIGYRIFSVGWHDKAVVHAIVAALRTLGTQECANILEMEESFGWAADVARKASVPVVVRLHGPWFLMGPLVSADPGKPFARRVRREGFGIAHAAGVSAPSNDVLTQARRHYRLDLKNAVVIPNPIAACPSEARWNLATCDRNRVLFVGRFDGHKGGDTILDAFAYIASRVANAILTFVGPDSGFVDALGKCWQIAEYIENRFADLSVRSRIEYLGFKTPREIEQLRRTAMVTVVCSRYETFSMTAAEAMAAGCPIAATDAGALRELLQHNQNAVLCPPNDPHALAGNIIRLLNDPDSAASLGAHAARDAESRYHPKLIARRTREFYREVLERSAHPRRPR